MFNQPQKNAQPKTIDLCVQNAWSLNPESSFCLQDDVAAK